MDREARSELIKFSSLLKPAFQEFTMDDRGWLYIRTYEKTEDPTGSHYDIFDGEGRYVARVLLAQRPRL